MYTIKFNYFYIMPVKFDSLLDARKFIEDFLFNEFNNYCDLGDYIYYSIMNDGEGGYFEICSL